jgi:hypothetical protein
MKKPHKPVRLRALAPVVLASVPGGASNVEVLVIKQKVVQHPCGE